MSKTYPTSLTRAYTPSAYVAQQLKDNRSLRSAIMAVKSKLLKVPAKGFVAGNINVVFFLTYEFSFTLMGENGVRRVGRSLMRMWGEDYNMKANEATVTSFLRWVGIEVTGEVARHPQDSHYKNNQYMKAAITADKNLVFEEDRFSVYDFLFGTFYFRDSEGTLFKFGGQTLYGKRGKGGLQKENVIALLREIGIEVEKSRIIIPPIAFNAKPTAMEYNDNPLMKRVILTRRFQFLKDPKRPFWEVGNFSVPQFREAEFYFFTGRILKWFNGRELLASRGIRTNNRKDILGMLGKIGIAIKSRKRKAEKPQKPIRLSQEEYQDDNLIRGAFAAFKETGNRSCGRRGKVFLS